MVVSSGVVVKEIDEDFVFSDKVASDKRILEILIRHCVVVQTKHFVNVYFILPNLLSIPSGLSKGPQKESAIININNCIVVSFWILLDFLDFDVLIGRAANLFFKS